MLIFESVIQQIEGVSVLGPMSLRVQEGRTVAICGPRGAGKTTLLRIALGVLRPQAGIVLVGGVPAAHPHLHSIRRRIGYVPGDACLFPHLSTADNATLVARSERWPRKRRTARLEEVSDLVGFPRNLLDEAPLRLSQIQRLRAGLLRALFLDPDLLLLDDIYRDLDPLSRGEVETDLQRALSQRTRTVVVTGDRLADLRALTDDFIVLRSGTIAQRGIFRELSEAPASVFVSEYVRAQRNDLHAG